MTFLLSLLLNSFIDEAKNPKREPQIPWRHISSTVGLPKHPEQKETCPCHLSKCGDLVHINTPDPMVPFCSSNPGTVTVRRETQLAPGLPRPSLDIIRPEGILILQIFLHSTYIFSIGRMPRGFLKCQGEVPTSSVTSSFCSDAAVPGTKFRR